MVEIEECADEALTSDERLLDAEAIAAAAANMTRPTARMHLESLAKKLRREGDALARVEKSRMPPKEKEETIDVDTSGEDSLASSKQAVNDRVPTAPPVPVATAVVSPPFASKSMKYISIDRFAFDAGGYNAPFVTLYVTLTGVGTMDRSSIKCDFTSTSFDLVVHELKEKSYRLFKDNLEKNIVPEKSKIIVKADKIIIKLAKVKGEYGSYDYWSELTDNKKSRKVSGAKEDPSASIMNLMKDMYDKGDDNMKKMIGETMMKQRSGELGGDKNAMEDV
jgi:calcyclin binding protein